MHAGCQTTSTYQMKGSTTGATTYTTIIKSYTSLYAIDIGYLGSTPGMTSITGSLTPGPFSFSYTLASKVLKLPATATLSMTAEDKTSGKTDCVVTQDLVVNYN